MNSKTSIRDTFFEECEELLEALSEGLNLMESGAYDDETVNAVFRAVHSIKGGAGAFALNDLVAFAHRFETVLDFVRSGKLPLSPELMHVLLRAADHLADHVEAAREDRVIASEITDVFVSQLDACLGEDLAIPETSSGLDDDPCFGFAAITLDFSSPLAIDDPLAALSMPAPIDDNHAGYLIKFRPQSELYTNGHDPALIIASLAELGEIKVIADLSLMPAWTDYDAQSHWLGWTITLNSLCEIRSVMEIFEFVEGLCELEIAPLQAADTPPEIVLAAPTTHDEFEPEALAPSPAVVAKPQGTIAQKTPAAPVRREPRSTDEDSDGRAPKPTLRVDLERVDRLINAVGELIINQAMIEQSILDMSLPSDSEVIAHVEDYRLFARDLQEAVMAIRAQPVKPLFQRMSRIVREAAEATGKSARLVTIGEGTEVDKTVIERLADPLTHMIRNAVDHGLETVEVRRAAGKEPEGTIRLSAAHRSGSVIITIRDDGAGLNRPKILEKAISKGLVAADAELTDSEIDNLLFLPGFSTADKISNLSGRGVGLDVVKNAVAALGGKIAITSHPGEGSEFSISLPLTLAVMDGMVISVAGQTMVIPIASVIETIRPAAADLHLLGTNEHLLSMRGKFLPMIDVAQCLGFPERDLNQQPLLLLVETEHQSQCALIVDAVHDQRQVVIKGLESNYGSIPGVSAATVLGDGQIALILDAEALTASRIALGHSHMRGVPSLPSALPPANGTQHAIH